MFGSSFCLFLETKMVILHEYFETRQLMIQLTDMNYKRLLVWISNEEKFEYNELKEL